MARLAKRIVENQKKLTPGKIYPAIEAVKLLQSMKRVKFDETVELCVVLGVDPRKSDQAVRGSIVLPKGTGKKVRVAVFTSAANTDAATKAGADIVGMEDLAEKIKAGQVDMDVVIASPDAMRVVGQLGQVLGPRGLMPNPKDGTVSPDVANAVKQAKSGQVRYRTDKAGLVHCPIGKISFNAEDIVQNFEAIVAALKKAKPNSAKGVYFKKVVVSSTMGPGLVVDVSSIAN